MKQRLGSMLSRPRRYFFKSTWGFLVLVIFSLGSSSLFAQPMFPGGSLSPDEIPKYVIPLVLPPVMQNNGKSNNYDIAVRQFEQQILPGGIWKKGCRKSLQAIGIPKKQRRSQCNYDATTVWSYGPAAQPVPNPGSKLHIALDLTGESGFNYPAFTFETESAKSVDVRWINELVTINDKTGKPFPVRSRKRKTLPHLLPVDQTLHWANPPQDCAFSPEIGGSLRRTDCAGRSPEQYTGPVPIVTHVHGSHVDPNSDGYPEAWWLPKPGRGQSFPANFASSGSFFDDATGENPGDLGYADYRYRNDQPATTLWYHDHSLGITRLNVYAGPAGFWLIRGGPFDVVKNGSKKYRRARLPSPAPLRRDTMGQLNTPESPVRNAVREIPLLIQDRSFNLDGSLFYPANRAYFETLNTEVGPDSNQFFDFPFVGKLIMQFAPPDLTDDPALKSQVPPIWNTETFFNTILVNGVTWPTLNVAPARYRLRFLNGANSRTFNMALFTTSQPGVPGAAKLCDPPDDNIELPIIQIGSDGGFMEQPVELLTGFATPLPGNGTKPKRRPTPYGAQALLLAPAERADVIVDFSQLEDGTIIRLSNTAPDSPFGGFGRGDPPADCNTTGQIMQFVVNKELRNKRDKRTTDPYSLQPVARTKFAKADNVRKVSLNEQDTDFGISYNMKDVFYPPFLGADVGEIPDTGEYTVCAEKSCTDEVQNEPFCAEPPCKPLSVSGFDPGGLDCPDTNNGDNAYRFMQEPFDPQDPSCEGGSPNLGVYGPMVDLLGTVGDFAAANNNPTGIPLRWTDDSGDSRQFEVKLSGGSIKVKVTEDPLLNTIEDWEIYNFTPDAHPIHIHLVQFNVINRNRIPGNRRKDGFIPACDKNGDPKSPPPGNNAVWNSDICWDRNLNDVVFPQEQGWKDTVIAHPGQVTTVRAKFDIPGLYVWHCHILEHEDNEMMRPYFVANKIDDDSSDGDSDDQD